MTNKVAYVTGGMGGIGTAMCQRLHQDGFTVVAGCGPTRDYQKWLDEQKALGFTFYASVGNVAEWESTVDAFAKAKADHGPISVLVNNAGITRDRMFLKITLEDWNAVISTNLTSMFNVTKQVVADMVEHKALAASFRSHQSMVKRVKRAKPTTRPPKPVCMVSPWRWRKRWQPKA